MARTENSPGPADLMRYGLVADHDEVPLRDRAHASAGDLITARCSDQGIGAWLPGRWLTNRDVLQITDTGRRWAA